MPPVSTATKRGTRKLSELAKHLSVPPDITATGWPDVSTTCRDKLGITFDDWQEGAGRLILAKREDGNLAAMVDGVGLSVCRQVGKTYLVGSMVFALCVNIPGLLVIWSAHHARTHGETFLAMQGFAKRQRVAAHIKQVYMGSGDEEIKFHNGSRILFGARERGFGRGIPGVDVLIFDEAQILSDRAMANMLATMNTSRFGLQLYLGTPPKPDDMAEAFTRMRTEALAGTLTDGVWIEFGADTDADGDDRAQWRKANPSFPGRTPVQSMLRLKRKLTASDWRREGLGIWDDGASSSVFPFAAWRSCADDEQIADDSPLFVSVDVSWNRSTAYVAVVGADRSGNPRGLLRHSCEPSEVLEYLTDLCGKRTVVGVAIQGTGAPVSSLLPDLERVMLPLSIPVQVMTVTDLQRACGIAYDAVVAGSVSHPGQPILDHMVADAEPRSLNDGWVLDRKRSGSDISGLVAWVNALWLWQTFEAPAVPAPFII
jgi:hypothetical protein